MNREEAINQLNDIKSELKEHLVKKDIVALDMAISALSAEGEYIKKEDVLNAIRKSDHYGRTQKIYVCHREVVDSIDELPTYSFPENKRIEYGTDGNLYEMSISNGKELSFPDREKGEWTEDGHHLMCPICGEYFCRTDAEQCTIPCNFCPNCGADMRKPYKTESEE